MEENPKTRVLIIDDDQTLCEMYAERLRTEEFDVATSFNGEEGLARAVDYAPQVILLDLMMPKVNGFDVLDILKSTPETKNIPVIILTALIQEENKQRGLKAGADDFIVKSETMPGEVITKIKAVIEKGKQAKEGQAST
jgi:DNA-binding response OmpR family regulator